MAEMNMIQALNSALDIQLKNDDSVIIFGEDVGFFGGVFRVTDTLQQKYGKHRVFDSPLAEGGIAATAFGMGINGLRPVVEIQFAENLIGISNKPANSSPTGIKLKDCSSLPFGLPR